MSFVLKQAERGTPVAEVCRKMAVSEATLFRWRQTFSGLRPSELRQLQEEITQLKKLVDDLSLDKSRGEGHSALAKLVEKLGLRAKLPF